MPSVVDEFLRTPKFHLNMVKFANFYEFFNGEFSVNHVKLCRVLKYRHKIFDRPPVKYSYRLYDRSHFVTGQTRPVMTGHTSVPVRAGYLTGHHLEQSQPVV